ncbi:MAG: CocE/NonD family hydrolase [Candidatus Latescibacterota bacterium]|nr:CocE/NonD family hydrolase [Candidatus Latescibacterota bacterium]
MPIRKGQTQLKVVPPYEKWALDLLTKADYGEYWQHPSYAPALFWDEIPDVPILIIGGWYDSYTRSTCKNFIGLSARKRGPVRMLMGPWTHGAVTLEQSYAGDVEFGAEAALDSFRDLHLRYFDWALKGVDTGAEAEPPVRIFVMGGGGGYRTSSGRLFHGGRWRDEAEWPLERTQYTEYYLHGDGTLASAKPNADGGSTVYRFDPANPVPSIGGNVSSLSAIGPLPRGVPDSTHAPWRARVQQILEPGGFDQTEGPQFYGCKPPYLPLGSRPDVLVFATEILAEDVEVTGPVEVKLWVSSTAPDTDFTAKLIDVYPPSQWYPHGYALNLTDSIARLRYRNGREQGEELEPGAVAELAIVLYPTSNLFVKGHRIRLDISSSNFPRFDVNPNTGDPIGTERRRTGADNRVHHNAAQASRIVLPIVRPNN